MQNSYTLLIIVGAILFVAGVLGGGLSLKEFKIPKFNNFTRVLSCIFGCLFIIGGIMIEQWGDNSANTTEEPEYGQKIKSDTGIGTEDSWANLAGELILEPTCISSLDSNRIDCFARFADNAMHHIRLDGESGGQWESLGGTLTSNPSSELSCVSLSSNRIDCFARFEDDTIHHKWWDGGSWGQWESLGGIVTSGPNCVSSSSNRIDCFVKGTDNAMFHRWLELEGNTWSPSWESLGGIVTSEPNCVSSSSNRIDCFVKGTDNAMWQGWLELKKNNWTGWDRHDGKLISDSEPTCISSLGSNRIDCFARFAGNTMKHKRKRGNDDWSGWIPLNGKLFSEPSCVSLGSNRIDCFARFADNAMHHIRLDGESGGPMN